jgi:hypothetical protein
MNSIVVIELTPSHTATLAQRLDKEGALSLIDRRKGQKQQLRVTAPVKAELFQQVTVDIITSGQTSGSKISNELKERCNIAVPARTLRHHLAQMGLREIKKSLPQLLAVVKNLQQLFLDMKHKLLSTPERPLIRARVWQQATITALRGAHPYNEH